MVFDNDLAILQDARVHAATSANVGRILAEGYWAHQPEAGGYRPLTTLSYLLNYAILGNGPNPGRLSHYNLGIALSQIPGRKPEAIAEMETVLRMTSDPRVQQILNRLRAAQP